MCVCYVCIHLSMRMWMYVCMCVSMYVCMHVYMCTCMCVCMYMCVRMCMYVLCIYVCTYVCLYVCMCMYLHVCIYLHVYMFSRFLKGRKNVCVMCLCVCWMLHYVPVGWAANNVSQVAFQLSCLLRERSSWRKGRFLCASITYCNVIISSFSIIDSLFC